MIRSFALLVFFAATIAAAGTRPNIIYIMTDDHAAQAMSCYGSKVNQTPQLDRLAATGTRFSNAFVTNSICTPGRASVLTGQYSHMNGVPVFNRFDGSRPNVAKMLQATGYATAMIGKWHLGSDPTGFASWIVLPGQGAYNDPQFLTPNGHLKMKGYTTDVITDLGIEWLEKRPKDKPFFLMLHHKAPHRNWTPDEKNRARFKDRVIPEPATLFDDYATRSGGLPANEQTVAKDLTRNDLKMEPPPDLTPEARRKWLGAVPTEVTITKPDGSAETLTGKALVRWKYQRYMQDYLACVQGVDDNLGRLLDHLDKSGLAGNTIVVYTSDNGFFLGEHGLYDKRFIYEPSMRVPLLIRWPGVTKAGSVTDRFALNVDFAPTFLAAAGAAADPGMQGRSLEPVLKDPAVAGWRDDVYYRYYHSPGHHNTAAHLGVRTATHKLVHFWKKDQWELFDLVADRQELNNLAANPAHAGKMAEMKERLARLQKELKDDGKFADSFPDDSVDRDFTDHGQLGEQGVAQAIQAAAVK